MENELFFLFRVTHSNRTIYTNIYICLLVDIWGTYNLIFLFMKKRLCLLKRLVMFEKSIPNTVPFTERKANLSDFVAF